MLLDISKAAYLGRRDRSMKKEHVKSKGWGKLSSQWYAETHIESKEI